MKRVLLASVGLFALGIATASAADLSRREVAPVPYKAAPSYVASPVYNWTGPYVGISGGGAWGRSDFSGPASSGGFDVTGELVGGTLGYNYQVNRWVLGLEGDISWSDIRGGALCGGLSCNTRNHWLGTARGRIGYAMDRFMPYVTGGAAFGDISTNIAGIGGGNETKLGWTVGGGVEGVIYGPWTAKLEYLYVDLGRGATIAGAGSDTGFTTNIVRAGINYRF